MSTLSVVGVCAAVCALSKIIAGFRDTVTVEQVDYIAPKDGSFQSLFSSAASNKQTWSTKKISRVALAYLNQLDNIIPESMSAKREEIKEALQDMYDYEGIGSSNQAYTVSYDNNLGKMYMFIYRFEYISESQFTAQNVLLAANFTMPSSYAIMATTKKNMFRTKVTHSIEEIPGSLTPEAVVTAISMLVAPCIGDFIDIPEDFKIDIVDCSESNPGIADGKSHFTK